jgi:putative transposase
MSGQVDVLFWRAVDDEGEVLGLVMQQQWDTAAALNLLERLLRNQPVEPTAIVTDRLKSYGSALAKLSLSHVHHNGKKRENNRSHLPIRRPEQQQQGFKSQASAQRFLASHAPVYNTFYTARHLTKRPTLRILRAAALETCSQATCA